MTPDEWPTAMPVAAYPHLDDWRTFLHAHALLSRRLDEELRDRKSNV